MAKGINLGLSNLTCSRMSTHNIIWPLNSAPFLIEQWHLHHHGTSRSSERKIEKSRQLVRYVGLGFNIGCHGVGPCSLCSW